MYKIKTFPRVLLFLNILFIQTGISAQDLDWDRLSFGGSLHFTFTGGDLYKYWGNYFSPGVLFQYKINNNFNFEGGISGSYLKPHEDNQIELPDFFLINSQAGIKYIVASSGNFNFNISPGFTNTTFIFTGDAADKAGDNSIEHEFGVYVSPGFDFKFLDGLWIESFFSQQFIFSSPEYIILYTLGLKFLVK
jgi:hypothetical protein